MEESYVEDNYLQVSIIMQMRLYDVMMSILGKADAKMAQDLMDMHAKGEYFCPPPAIAIEEEQ